MEIKVYSGFIEKNYNNMDFSKTITESVQLVFDEKKDYYEIKNAFMTSNYLCFNFGKNNILITTEDSKAITTIIPPSNIEESINLLSTNTDTETTSDTTITDTTTTDTTTTNTTTTDTTTKAPKNGHSIFNTCGNLGFIEIENVNIIEVDKNCRFDLFEKSSNISINNIRKITFVNYDPTNFIDKNKYTVISSVVLTNKSGTYNPASNEYKTIYEVILKKDINKKHKFKNIPYMINDTTTTSSTATPMPDTTTTSSTSTHKPTTTTTGSTVTPTVTPKNNFDYNDFPTDYYTHMPVGVKIYTDNSQKSKEINKQLFDNLMDYMMNKGDDCDPYVNCNVLYVDDVICDKSMNIAYDYTYGVLLLVNNQTTYYSISSDGTLTTPA